MYNSMYSNKKAVERKIDIQKTYQFIGYITPTLYLAQHTQQTDKKVAVKVIPLHTDSPQVFAGQQAVLRKVFASSLYYLKPQSYDFRDNSLYLISPVNHLSLQSLIWIHKRQKRAMSRQALRQFTTRIYEGLARLKQSDIFPRNLKPSNLFLQQRETGQNNWVWSQAGLYTNNPTQAYMKINIMNNKSSIVAKVDPLEFEFYSLGIMLIEIITLQPVQEIDQVVRSRSNLQNIKNFTEASGHYGPAIVNIIKLLLDPPNDNNLNKAINQYKQYVEDEGEQQPDYAAYHFTAENIEKYLKEQLLMSIQNRIKQSIADKSISARQTFDVMARLDPKFEFGFTAMEDFEQFLHFLGAKLTPGELLFVSTYFYQKSLIRYFRIVQRVFPAKELIENIIIKAVESYDSFKEFYQAQTKGRDFWKVEQISKFLQSLDIPFQEKDVLQTMKSWSGSDKVSIKYDQIYKYFKPVLGLSMSLSVFQKQKTEHSNEESHLTDLLKQLMTKEPDLIAFFRKHDINQNWILDYKIEKVLKSYLKCGEQTFKKAIAEMWEKGSIPGNLSKKINYVYLIRNLELYEKEDLLRKIITQKVNESDRVSFYEKYKKDEKGWTFHSLIDFNDDQHLDFEEAELKALFRELDLDSSGTIDMKQLYFRLTGLKEFDYQTIIEQIKGKVERRGVFLFENFKDLDPRARLVLGQPKELLSVLQTVGITGDELSEDHLNQLYQKFSRNGKFQYLSFLFQFYSPAKLFLAAAIFMIEVNYRGNFDKLFAIGLQGGKKKWNRASLTSVNEELVLGFRENKIDEVWKTFDPNGDESLTKGEVASIFSYRHEEAQELTYKPLENIHDIVKKGKPQEEHREKTNSRNPSLRTKVPQDNKQKSIIQEFGRLGERKLQNLPLQLFRQSESNTGKIDQQAFLKILSELGLKFIKTDMVKILSRFKAGESSRKITIDYISFYFFILDSLYQEQFPKYLPKYKAVLCKTLIKEVKRSQKLNNSDLFKNCRKKDKMKLIDFQEMFNQLLDVNVMGSDLEQAWTFWGEQEYLNLQDFDKILETNEFKGAIVESGFKEKDIYRQPKVSEGKMKEFVQNQDDLGPLELRNMVSFGQKDSRFERKGRSSKAIDNRREDVDQKRGQYGKDRGQSAKDIKQEREQTGRFGPQKKKSLFASKPVQQILELQQSNEKSMVKRPYEKDSSKNKTQLFQMLKKAVDQDGDKYLNELFAKTNVIESKRFISCLSINYNFAQEDAAALAEHLATFGKIKLTSLQNKLVKKEDSEIKDDLGSKSKDRRRSKNEREQPSKMSPGKEKERGGGSSKLVDPRRQKINVPLVKQHIRILITSFCKRFEPSELESFFFPDKDYISRDDFSSKCQSISTTFTPSTNTKIFDYLKPDSNDRVSILTFKLATGMQDEIVGDQQDYLPQELQKELKIVFQKADKDRSGLIQSNEIQDLLSSLGFNQNVKQIENYFARMDANFDNKISYSQFRHFIEDQILPQLSTFDEEEEQLEELLNNNDIFRHGSLSPQTLQALIQKYGVKFNLHQIQVLVRALNPQGTEVNINHFMNAVRDPALYNGKIKAILYRIRLRKKVQLRQIQKVFQNISSCFVLAYTSAVMYRQQLNISSPYRPTLHQSALFYNDLPIKDIRKINNQTDQGLIGGDITNNDILVQILLKEISGVPIPQKAQIKGNICKRYMNVSIFDLSAESLKSTIWQVQAEWDPQIQDVWRFSNNVRSLIVKISDYDPRKYQKCILLFELIMVIVQGGKTLDINCGCANMAVRQLLVPQGKTSKILKLIAGLPNRSKQIDKAAISKRTGWKSFFGSQTDSQLEMEFIHQNKFKNLHQQIVALPSQAIFNRKALPFLWTYREYLAQNAFQSSHLNRFLPSDLRILTFLLTLDVPDLFSKVWLWWKDKAEPLIKTLKDSKNIFKILMQELYLVIHSKQFQLLKKHPSKQYFHNKSLMASRSKLLNDVFENIQNWLENKQGEHYKRRKNYSLNYGPLQIHEVSMPKEHINFMQNLARLAIK